MKGSKKKKILGFIAILAVLVIGAVVILKFVFPDAELKESYEIAHSISQNENLEYLENNLYKVSVTIAAVDSSNENIEKNTKMWYMLNSYTSLNEQMQSALLFNTRGKAYNKLTRNLRKQADAVKESLADSKNYLKDTLLVYTDSNPNYTLNDIQNYVDALNAKLTILMENQRDFYNTLVDIFNENYLLSLQNNNAVKINVELCDLMLDYANANYSEISSAKLALINSQCDKDFTNTTYNKSQEINTLREKVDVGEIAKNYVESSLQTLIDEKQNKEEYTTFVNFFFGI